MELEYLSLPETWTKKLLLKKAFLFEDRTKIQDKRGCEEGGQESVIL